MCIRDRSLLCGTFIKNETSKPATINSAKAVKNTGKLTTLIKFRPRKGPIAIARFIDMAKYPSPSPRRLAGIISAAIAPVTVVKMLNQIPWKNRNPSSREKL